jgi:hypothetical protein
MEEGIGMKKLIAPMFAFLLLVFALAACSNPISEVDASDNDGEAQNDIAQPQDTIPSEDVVPPQDEAPPQRPGQDYTIEVAAYDIDEAAVTPAGSIFSQSSRPYACQTVSQLDAYSVAVVEATIINREFFAFSGIAYTKLDIFINTSIKGEFVPGDTLSIIQSGGYVSIADMVAARNNGLRFTEVPEDQWATTYFVESADGNDFPEVGEQYVYFLHIVTLGDEMYWPLNEAEGTFKLDEDGRYARNNPFKGYVPNHELEFSSLFKPNGDLYPNAMGNSVINSFSLDELFEYFG